MQKKRQFEPAHRLRLGNPWDEGMLLHAVYWRGVEEGVDGLTICSHFLESSFSFWFALISSLFFVVKDANALFVLSLREEIISHLRAWRGVFHGGR